MPCRLTNQIIDRNKDYLNSGVDLIDYGDTIQIVRDPNAGYWKYLWLVIIFSLLFVAGYEIISLIVQLSREETGTKISFENLNLKTFVDKFKVKACFKNWPSNFTQFKSMFTPNVTYTDDKYWMRDWILATFLLRPNELGWVIPKTIEHLNDSDKDEFSSFVHTTGNITVFDSKGYGGLQSVAESILYKFYKILNNPAAEQHFRNADMSPSKPIPCLLEGPSHQLCVKHPLVTPILLRMQLPAVRKITDEQFQSYLIGSLEFYIKEFTNVKFVNWLISFYGGGIYDSELSGKHFQPNKKESSFHKVALKRYEYLNTWKKPCEKSDNLNPPGFAQTICQNKCWWQSYTNTFNCNKSSLLQNFTSNLDCVFPRQMMKYNNETTQLEDQYTEAWMQCVFKAECHKKLFCTEWQMEVEELNVHPFKWMCVKEDGSFNLESCRQKEQVFLFSSQVEVVKEYKLHTFVTVLSDSGGQIGLWIGLSILELVKLIFSWIMKARNSKKLRALVSRTGSGAGLSGDNDGQKESNVSPLETKNSNATDGNPCEETTQSSILQCTTTQQITTGAHTA